jgi:hypothetical protein
MIHQSIRQMNKMLGQLDTWLVKTTEYAKKKPFHNGPDVGEKED